LGQEGGNPDLNDLRIVQPIGAVDAVGRIRAVAHGIDRELADQTAVRIAVRTDRVCIAAQLLLLPELGGHAQD
jgi:hypothetical protein